MRVTATCDHGTTSLVHGHSAIFLSPDNLTLPTFPACFTNCSHGGRDQFQRRCCAPGTRGPALWPHGCLSPRHRPKQGGSGHWRIPGRQCEAVGASGGQACKRASEAIPKRRVALTVVANVGRRGPPQRPQPQPRVPPHCRPGRLHIRLAETHLERRQPSSQGEAGEKNTPQSLDNKPPLTLCVIRLPASKPSPARVPCTWAPSSSPSSTDQTPHAHPTSPTRHGRTTSRSSRMSASPQRHTHTSPNRPRALTSMA